MVQVGSRKSDASEYLGSSAFLVEGISDPEVLEVMAVREGLNLALDLNVQKIKLATDCLNVVKALEKPDLGRYSHVLHEISVLKASFTVVSFVHETRVPNKEPHDIAHSMLGSPARRYVWLGNPPLGVVFPIF
jgi:ribonuclease HI